LLTEFFFKSVFWLIVAETAVVVLGTACVVRSFIRLIETVRHGPALDEVLDFERWVHLSNGVTPLLPIFFICATICASGYFKVKKLYLASRFSVPSPFPVVAGKTMQNLGAADQAIRSELLPPNMLQNHPTLFGASLVLVLAGFIQLWHESIPPLDGHTFAFLALAGLALASILVILTACKFYFVWKKVQRLLRALALLPMSDAFARLPSNLMVIFGRYLSARKPWRSHLVIAKQQYELLQSHCLAFRRQLRDYAEFYAPVPAGLQSVKWSEALEDFDREFEDGTLKPVLEVDDEANLPMDSCSEEPDTRATEIAKSCLTVLRHFWPAHSMDEAFGKPIQTEKQEKADPLFLSLPEGHAVREWVLCAENFVSIVVTRYLTQFIAQLRTMLTFLTVGSVLLVLAASSYPLCPQSLMLLFLTILGGAVAVLTISFLFQFNRDELVSRISHSTPNRFTPDPAFINAAATYVLPIALGLMVQFPFFASGVRSLIEPLFHIIR
jgi:hypothetical protein